jgi:signal transduction histidine kinase
MSENSEDNLHKNPDSANKHRNQRDDARAERDSALNERDSARDERDSARDERDDFENINLSMKKNNIAQEQFVATLSHDLRNPISAIKMAAELLIEGADEILTREMVALIDRNADLAGELINQLLDAHLIKAGQKLPINPQLMNMGEVLTKCHEALDPKNRDRIQVIGAGSQCSGYWDAALIERALKNLLSNALKFGDDQKIKFTVWQESDITGISVKNHGSVISLDNQLKIFNINFRVEHNDTAHAKKGWGLGLTLVKGIAESHNGKIDVVSSQASGTIFTIRLPNDAR